MSKKIIFIFYFLFRNEFFDTQKQEEKERFNKIKLEGEIVSFSCIDVVSFVNKVLISSNYRLANHFSKYFRNFDIHGKIVAT